MRHFFDLRPDSTRDQLDRELREFPRKYGQIPIHDALRRRLDRASKRRPSIKPASTTERTTASEIESQLKRELNLAFTDLGGVAFALVHHGALDDKRLASRAQRIHELYAQLDAVGALARARSSRAAPAPGSLAR
jgi:hypothetical protein